jgi:DNA-binding transcriptional MerR regulator
MKREVIEFLKKSGYTLEEIMSMDTNTDIGTDTNTDSGTDSAKNITSPKINEKGENLNDSAKTDKDTNNEKTLTEQLAELRGEIKALRDITHAENRNRDTIENPGKKLTFEEDVEKLIEEVNR